MTTEKENARPVINPLTGWAVDSNLSAQKARGPLTPLETSRTDAVADYFRERGEEPSYEAISRLAPPLKYVDAQFRVYPLVLGEKNGAQKVRLLSNARELHLDVSRERENLGIGGSGWHGSGLKLRFRVGEDEELQNAEPRWRNGYLPVAEFRWQQCGAEYSLQSFASLLPDTTRALCAWLKIGARRLEPNARVEFAARVENETPLASRENYLVHQSESTHALRAGYSGGWRFEAAAQTLRWQLSGDENEGEACLVVLNEPREHGLLLEPPGDTPMWAIDVERSRRASGSWLAQWAQPHWWNHKREEYCRAWDDELQSGARVETPEAVVNNAQKSVRVQSQIIATENQMSYSAQNQYERSYTDEASQAILGLAYWGHLHDAARYLGHLAFYTQNGLTLHELGLRLHWFCRYIALSNDEEFQRRNRERMQHWAHEIIDGLSEEHHGLAPPTKHCGDLKHRVYSFPANAVAWRGVRDFALLDGDEELSARAANYRMAIVKAAEASLDTSTSPPFLPVSLYSEDEPTPEFLTQTTLAAYWSLIMPYGLYAGVLPDDHEVTRALLETFEQRGGLCAGLVRWTTYEDYTPLTILLEMGLDDLYGAKLCDVWARRDEADKLVLALYGKLGLGLTPETFIAGEGASLAASRVFGEESSDGRSFYLPPISASQMMFAIALRHCLVFDFDSRGDGIYDTLRLAFSTPRRWLAEGEKLTAEKLPTAFGQVSYEIVSHLDSQSAIEARASLPGRSEPRSTRLRLRVPNGRRLRAVTINGQSHAAFNADDETIDLSGSRGEVKVRAEYS